jgi:hypothetical protein
MQQFTRLYKEFLKDETSKKDLIEANQKTLKEFQDKNSLENKSIHFLPAFFNFIEFYLDLANVNSMQELKSNTQEVKKYLIVGLSNIMFSNKKEDENIEDEDEDYTLQKNMIKSRLDLLFARYNLVIKKFDEACDKLTNSVILYSEIYGPESIGLTINYYYLAIYFDEAFEKDRSDVIKGIVLRIAEIWKKYFLGEKYEWFQCKFFY